MEKERTILYHITRDLVDIDKYAKTFNLKKESLHTRIYRNKRKNYITDALIQMIEEDYNVQLHNMYLTVTKNEWKNMLREGYFLSLNPQHL